MNYCNIYLLLIFLTAGLFADEPETAGIYIESIPTACDVFINGEYIGATPLSYVPDKSGTHTIKIIKEGVGIWTESIHISTQRHREITAVIPATHAILNLNSDPEPASIFINDTLIGRTPIEGHKIPIGEHTIRMEKQYHTSRSRTLSFYPIVYNISMPLQYEYGYLLIEDIPEKTELFIDGKRYDFPTIPANRIMIGPRRLSAKIPDFPRRVNINLDITPHSRTMVSVLTERFSTRTLIMSAFIPGLGQYYHGDTIKGILIFTGHLVLGGTTAAAWNNYSDKYNDFTFTLNRYLNATNESEALLYRDRMMEAHSDAKDAKLLRNISLGVFAAAYTYNLIDTILFHSRLPKLVTFTSQFGEVQSAMVSNVNLGTIEIQL